MNIVAGHRHVVAGGHRQAAIEFVEFGVFDGDAGTVADIQRRPHAEAHVVDRPGFHQIAVEHAVLDGNVAAARHQEVRRIPLVRGIVGIVEHHPVERQVLDHRQRKARETGWLRRISRSDRDVRGELHVELAILVQREVSIVAALQQDGVAALYSGQS